MLGRLVERGLTLLDWCWPLPLGILFGALVFSVSAVSWWVLHDPETKTHTSARRSPRSDASANELPPVAPSLSESTAPTQTNPSVTPTSSSRASAGNERPTRTSPQPERAGAILAPGTRVSATKTPPVREAPFRAQTAQAKPEMKKYPLASESEVAGPAHKLSPGQEAELKDRLILGRFFTDRKDYLAALAEFQAALAIDPSSREAQAALQQARDASQVSESSVQP